MPVRSEPWPEGTPTWVDLGADDLDAAKEFYRNLFGWDYSSTGEDGGGYLLAQIEGKSVAGIGPKQSPVAPTAWTTYIGAENVDTAAAKVSAAGGTVLAGPFDVTDAGRMAIACDSAGAAFGIWQARSHIGAELFNEPGTLVWNELHTRDYDQSRKFYSEAFGHSFNDIGNDGFVYSTFKRPGDRAEIAGILHDTEIPESAPNHWLTWFASDNTDATADKAVQSGSTLLMPPTDSPFGRMTIIRAPQGEVLGVITPTAG